MEVEKEVKELRVENLRLGRDNKRMHYINVSNQTRIKAMSQDVEYYKFRVKEMSDVSEEEEDAIRKVIHKNQPKDKILDNDDLQDYVDGKEIKEYDEYEEALNERELMKKKELLRQKRRKLPVSLATQTDPPEGIDFGIQIKDGEEVIPFVDIRPLSGKLKPQKHENLTLDDYSNFDSMPNLKR